MAERVKSHREDQGLDIGRAGARDELEHAPQGAGAEPAHVEGQARMWQQLDARGTEGVGRDVAQLQSALGVTQVQVRIGSQPRRRGARGLAHRNEIFVDAETWAAGDLQARIVVAHELVHHAQARLPATGEIDRAAAEQEARDLALRYATRGEIARPRVPLELETRAHADTDADKQPVDPTTEALQFINQWGESVATRLGGWYPLIDKGREPLLADPPFLMLSVKGFVGQVFEHLLGRGDIWRALSRILGEATLVTMVQRGRDEKTYFGDPGQHYRFTIPEFDHFTDDLRSRVVALIGAALDRLSRRYAKLRTANALRERRKGYRQWPLDEYVPQVDPAQLVAGHPMDPAVIAALCESEKVLRNAWVGDYDQVLKAFPDLEAEAEVQRTEMRKVKFLFEVAEGLDNWITVLDPADATREEVANELYGDSTQAYLLIQAGRRFGMPSPLRTPLAEPNKSRWQAELDRRPPTTDAKEQQLVVTSDVAFKGERDPAREMLADPTLAEAAIRAQSEGVVTKDQASSVGVLQRYSYIIQDLQTITQKVAQLPVAMTGVVQVLARAQQRAERIKAGDAQLAATYDISSTVQHEVTMATTSAVTNLADAWTKLMAGFNAQPAGFDVYGEMSGPYRKVTAAFVDAIAASELPETGRDRLDAAQLAAREMPIETLEVMLANARSMIMAARANVSDPDTQYQNRSYDHGLGEMEQTEAWVRDELRQAREIVRVDPGQLGKIIGEVQERISELQFNASILLSVQECNALVHELEQHYAGWFDPTNKTHAMMKEEAVVENWRRKWDTVWDKFLTAKYAPPENKKKATEDLDKAFKGLANDPEWKQLHDEVGKLIEHEEAWAKWVHIGIMIGIAIATMGAGTLAEGAAAGAGLGALGTGAAIVGTEAITATVLGQMLVDDPTLKGFFVQLGENLVTFAIFRGVSAGYRGIVGSGKAAVATELVGFQLEETVRSVYTANEEHKRLTGKSLSTSEMWDVAKDGLIVAGATFLAGQAGKKPLEQLRWQGEVAGRAWIGQRIDAIEMIDAQTVGFATTAQKSKKPGDLATAIDNQKRSLETQRQFFDDLLANNGQRARDAGIDPATLKDRPGEIAQQLHDNQIAKDMLALEPVSPGQFLYPADDLPGFLTRQKGDPAIKAKVEPVEADPYTGAKRYRVTPENGSPFTVTEKLAGMGRVVGGLEQAKKPDPASGLPDLGDKPMFSAAMIEKQAHIRVGYSLATQEEGLQVIRGLSEGNAQSYARIGLDPPNLERFHPMEIEWGLGQRVHEFIIIRGDFESVNWADYPGVVAISHTHPFRPGKGLKGLDQHGLIPFESLLPGGGGKFNPNTFHNQVVVFPSAADIVFMGMRGIDGHVVQTPYRIKIVDGKPMLAHPTPDATGAITGAPLDFVIGRPELVGYYEGDHDTPVYKAHLAADAAGFSREMYAVNHPVHGSLISFSPPAQMEAVTPGARQPEPGPVTRSGEAFVPKDDLDRQAAAAWEEMKTGTQDLKATNMTFDGVFLPMYRDGWRYDPAQQKWGKPGSHEAPRVLPDHVSVEDVLQRLNRDPFIAMLVDEHVVARADMLSELRGMNPGGQPEPALIGQLKTALGGKVVDHVVAQTRDQLTQRLGSVGEGERGLHEARKVMFDQLTHKLAPADRDALAAEFYRRSYLHNAPDAVQVPHAQNQALGVSADRTVDAIDEKQIGSSADYGVENTAVKVVSGDTVLSPRQVQEARDFRRIVNNDVATPDGTVSVTKLRYVFTSEAGARKNLAFIEAMLDGTSAWLEIDVFDAKGKHYRITDTAQLANKELDWLTTSRHQQGYASDEMRMSRELADGDIADAARSATATGGDYDPKYRLEITSADYDLSKQADRERFAQEVITRARNHGELQGGRTGKLAVFLDVRDQTIDPDEIQRLRMRIVDGSRGAIHDDGLVVVQGHVDKSLDQTRYQQLRNNAVRNGAEGALADQVIAILQAHDLPASIVATWAADPLATFAHSEVVAQLQALQPLAQSGRVRGLSSWLEFAAPKRDPVQRAAELREAHRRLTADPGIVIDLGSDLEAPVIKGETQASFDAAVSRSGAHETSYEVATVGGRVRSGKDITQGVAHAGEKAQKREEAGVPIVGRREAVIQIDMADDWKSGGGAKIRMNDKGDRELYKGATTIKKLDNIFDEFRKHITDTPYHVYIDRIVVVDGKGVKATYDRSGNTWTKNP